MQPQTRNDGAIAQLVEQRTENPCVPGSIPGGTTQEEKDKSFSSFYIHTYTNHKEFESNKSTNFTPYKFLSMNRMYSYKKIKQ